VARLLAAQLEPALVERVEDVAIADRGLDDLDVVRGHHAPQSEVAHHRDDHRVAGERAALVAEDGALVAYAERSGDRWQPRVVMRRG